jgi:hypothetical protein
MVEPDPDRAERGSGLARGLLAAAAVLAVLVGMTLTAAWLRADGTGDDDRSTPDDSATGLAPADELATDWRYESFRDVQVQVPVAWEYRGSPGSDWCVGEPSPDEIPSGPYVDLRGPYWGSLSILCPNEAATPDLHGDGVPRRLWAPHVSFEFAEQRDRPEDGITKDGGWTRIVRTVGGARIRVLTDDTHLADARRIVDSATVVEVDANGCEATSAIQAKGYPRPSRAFDVLDLGSVDSIAVCQYAHGAGTDKPWKLGSRVISGDAAQNLLLSAIQEAPVGSGPNTPETCSHDYVDGTAVVLRLREGDRVHDLYVYYESCINNGFDDGTTRRSLTAASCEPLWGGRVLQMSGSSAPFRVCHGRPAGTGK